MEENTSMQLIKPEFNGEIEAHIKTVGEIESNMNTVKTYVENLNNYYKNVTFTEETIKEAMDEKAKVNKFKDQVANYRKNIIAEYNKPIKVFEDTAKETEKLLKDTYDTINSQVNGFREKQKVEKKNELISYFNEYSESLKIDFLKFEDLHLNITLTATVTSLRKQIKDFVDRINIDTATIALQDDNEEILVEYKANGYKLNEAMQTIAKRRQAIEEEKQKKEELREKIHQQMSDEADKVIGITNQGKDNVLQAPTVEEENEKQVTVIFKVTDTKTRLRSIKEFLENGGYKYE